ncbi:phage tail tape measure protein [Planococcus beigongshangi]|uniref:phage tail tape measure protein n=1 Tax=Planococcus beigongshangi TaxID=2782536 RepID=UPI00193C0E19|nr:phage tail tape measure protein [Planococcus beigongshangi]
MAEGPIQGLSIGLGLDTTGLDKGLKHVKQNLKLASSEMKANMSAFDHGEKSVRKYETQLTGLNKKLELQKTATNSARTEYERMVAQHGEGSRQAERAAIAYNNEVAAVNNLERHVNNLTDEFRQFQVEQEAANSGMGRLGASLDNVGGKVSAIGGKMTSAGKGLSVGLTAPILAFGAAGIAAFNEVDEAIDTIITKTGATGEAAEGFTESFKTVAKRVPQDLQSVGEAIGEVNTQFGFMGEELEDASERMLQFADINGTDVTSASIAAKQAIEAYGLANEDLDDVLDAVTKTAQDTGQSVDDLFDKTTKGAPQIKALGLEFAEGAALIGGFEKAGVDSSAALSSLSKAQVIFAEDGKTLEEGLNDTMDAIMGAKDETEALTIAAEVFGTKGGPRMVDAIQRGTFNLEDFAGAGEKAAGAVVNTFEETVDPIDQAAIAMNNAKLAMGEVGDTIQVALLPFMEKATEVLGNVADKFSGMSPEAKNAALMIGGIAAAAGPVLMVLGGLASGLGAVITFVGSAATAVSIMGTGVAAATPLIGGLATAFTVLTGPVGLGIAAIAGITAAGIGLYNHFKNDAIPEVDRFGDQISDTTKEALGKFFELSDGVGSALTEMAITSDEMTKEMADTLSGNFASMNEQILEGLRNRHAEEANLLKESFANSSALTAAEEEAILKRQGWRHEMELAGQEAKEARAQEIIQKAYDEKRDTTEAEEIELEAIRTFMNNKAVESLSANEMESKIIMQRMKDTAGALSAQQAAEVVKRSAEARDGAVNEAEKQYEETVAQYINMRDNTGELTEEQATKLIAEAKKTRDQTVGHAKNMHKEVVGEAKLQAEGHIGHVNWETGEILSKWEVYKNNVARKFKESNENNMADFKRWGGQFLDAVESTKNNAIKGWNNYKTGINKVFRQAGQDGLNSLGSMVNGVIKGINWVLSKLNVKTIGFWAVPNILGQQSAGTKSGAPVKAYAHGTKGHTGGLALVGDGVGSNAGSELIRTPDGKVGLSPATNTLLDLPKGTMVLSATETKKLFNSVPRYANGIGDMFSAAWGAGKNLFNAGKAKVFDIFDYLANPKKLLDVGLAAVGFKMPSIGGFMKDVLSGGLNKAKSGAIDFIKNKLAIFEESAGGNGQGFGPKFRLTSKRGWRIHPITGKRSFHQGDDWGAPSGTPIASQASGTVSFSGYLPSRGNTVRVKSGIYEHLYQHNSRNSVSAGQAVRKGQTVGLVGSTGDSTGPHLHHELKKNGVNINPSGLATGGMTTGFTASTLHEEGYPEIVIPTAPKRRTDAMKLLALAAKKIQGGDSNVIRPNQLPNVQGNNTIDALVAAAMRTNEFLMQQNQLLMQLLQKDGNVYMDSDALVGAIGKPMDVYAGSASRSSSYMKGIK